MAAAAVSRSAGDSSSYSISQRVSSTAKRLQEKVAAYQGVYEHTLSLYNHVKVEGAMLPTAASPVKGRKWTLTDEKDFRTLSVGIKRRFGVSEENQYFFIYCKGQSSCRLHLVRDKSTTFEAALENVLSTHRQNQACYSLGFILTASKLRENLNVDENIRFILKSRPHNLKPSAHHIRLCNSFYRLQFYRPVLGQPGVVARETRPQETIPTKCTDFATLAAWTERRYGYQAASTHFFVSLTLDRGAMFLLPVLSKEILLLTKFHEALTCMKLRACNAWRFSIGVIVDPTHTLSNKTFDVSPWVQVNSKTGALMNKTCEIIYYRSKSKSR